MDTKGAGHRGRRPLFAKPHAGRLASRHCATRNQLERYGVISRAQCRQKKIS
jgi:hypothetical protein